MNLYVRVTFNNTVHTRPTYRQVYNLANPSEREKLGVLLAFHEEGVVSVPDAHDIAEYKKERG